MLTSARWIVNSYRWTLFRLNVIMNGNTTRSDPHGKKRLVSLTASLLLLLLLSLAPAAFAAPRNSRWVLLWDRYCDVSLGASPSIPSISAGETLIDAESLSHYGFTVTWLPDKRELVITDGLSRSHDDAAGSDSLLDMACGTPGACSGPVLRHGYRNGR